jgi:hypothetical protein
MKEKTMGVVREGKLLLLFLTLGLSSAEDLLEPAFTQHVGVLPRSVCQELIALGEDNGFNVEEESIDQYAPPKYKVTSQSIDVYERNRGIISPAIWDILEPWIPKITGLVKESIDTEVYKHFFPDEQERIPKLDWVFFRKFSPDTDRISLRVHPDSNMYSVNIALNDDFKGGGLFYLKPSANQDGKTDDGRPVISDEYRDYDWLSSQKRQNSSNIVYPALGTGDLVIYNYTVYHGVAPVEAGTRYSFVLFYDMDNPAIQVDFDNDGFGVTFYHEIEDVDISLLWVDTRVKEHPTEVIEEKLLPYTVYPLVSHDGHVFRAVISGTDTVVSEFVVSDTQALYTIKMEEYTAEL